MDKVSYCMRPIPILLLTVLIISCAENPVTRTREVMIFSEADEVRFGRNLHEEIQSKLGLYEDTSLKRYVQTIGRKISDVSHRPHLDFTFEIADSDEVNAFALPGGYIYVTRGLLCYLNNEAQLAGVLGHEIGHVSYRHSMKAVQANIGANILLNIIALGTGSQFWVQVSDISLAAIMAGYSREYEYQADNLSVEYALRAGYDPNEIANFLQALARMEPGRSGPLVGIFADHPLLEKRVANVQARIREKKDSMRVKELMVKGDEYLSHIDGLALQRKRGWVREKGEMRHGEIGLAIPYVRSFIYERGSSPDELVIYDSQGAFAIEVVPIKGKTPLRGGIEEFERRKGLRKRVSMRLFKEERGTPVCTYAVNGEEMRVAFLDFFPHTLAIGFTERSFSRGGLLFEQLISRSRRLKEDEISLYREERIKVYRLKQDTTLQELVSKLSGKTDEKLLKRICLLNGLSKNEMLKSGKSIKLIVGGEALPEVE